jgi:putative acetyltransferase
MDSETSLKIAAEDAGGVAAMKLIEELCSSLNALYGTLASPFSPNDVQVRRAVFVVARLGDEPVGCGALRPLDGDADAVELKRMFVKPEARRRGIARRLLADLEARARAFGYKTIRLETGDRQREAIALYEACGYRRIEPFGHYVGNPISVCFERHLGP